MRKKNIFCFGMIALLLTIITGCSSNSSQEAALNDVDKVKENQTEIYSEKINENQTEIYSEKINENTTNGEIQIEAQTDIKEEAKNTNSQATNNSGSTSKVDSQNSNEVNSESIENTNNTTKNNTASSNDNVDINGIHLASGEEAIDYLKTELDMKNNEDIIFDDMGGTLETDQNGSYYSITLYSKEYKKAGGSGTLERYKVYQDGKYELI